jgi:hypothetical protein
MANVAEMMNLLIFITTISQQTMAYPNTINTGYPSSRTTTFHYSAELTTIRKGNF